MPESSQKNNELRPSLVKYAANILGKKPYFYNTLKRKLEQRAQKFESNDAIEVIDSILEDLKKAGYLDDSYLAQMFVLRCLRKLQGPKIIVNKLRLLGVSSDTIKTALNSDESLVALKDAKDKILSKYPKEEPYKGHQKLYQRGF